MMMALDSGSLLCCASLDRRTVPIIVVFHVSPDFCQLPVVHCMISWCMFDVSGDMVCIWYATVAWCHSCSPWLCTSPHLEFLRGSVSTCTRSISAWHMRFYMLPVPNIPNHEGAEARQDDGPTDWAFIAQRAWRRLAANLASISAFCRSWRFTSINATFKNLRVKIQETLNSNPTNTP